MNQKSPPAEDDIVPGTKDTPALTAWYDHAVPPFVKAEGARRHLLDAGGKPALQRSAADIVWRRATRTNRAANAIERTPL